MKNAAKVIRDNSMRYAKLMTDEMGKPITDGLAELEKCASCCEYSAEMSDKFLKPKRAGACFPATILTNVLRGASGA